MQKKKNSINKVLFNFGSNIKYTLLAKRLGSLFGFPRISCVQDRRKGLFSYIFNNNNEIMKLTHYCIMFAYIFLLSLTNLPCWLMINLWLVNFKFYVTL